MQSQKFLLITFCAFSSLFCAEAAQPRIGQGEPARKNRLFSAFAQQGGDRTDYFCELTAQTMYPILFGQALIAQWPKPNEHYAYKITKKDKQIDVQLHGKNSERTVDQLRSLQYGHSVEQPAIKIPQGEKRDRYQLELDVLTAISDQLSGKVKRDDDTLVNLFEQLDAR